MQIIKMFSKKKACRDMLGVVTVEANATSTAPVRATMSVKVPLCGCLPRLTRSCRVASFRFKDEVEGGFSSGSHTSLTAALDLQQLLRYSRRNEAAQLKVRVMGRRQEVAVARVYLDCFLLELLRHGPAEGFVLKVQEGKLSLKMVMSPQELRLEEGSEPHLNELNTDGTAKEHEENEPRSYTEAVTAASLPLSLSNDEQPADADGKIGCEDPVAVEAVTSPVLPLPEDIKEQPPSVVEQIGCDNASAAEVDEAEDSGLDVHAFPTSYCPPSDTTEGNVESWVSVKVKTWAEEVDEAEDSGLDVHAFPTSYCPPVKTSGADLVCCVKVKEESAEARPAAAESSQHIRSESLTSRAPDEPAAVVVLRHGRWYVCTREEAVKRRRHRPRPSRKAHSKTPK